MNMTLEIPSEARRLYLTRRRQDLIDCWEAIRNGDFEQLERIGHQIRGNAVTFGYEHLGSIAEVLESSARVRNPATARLQVVEFEKFLSSIDSI